VTAGGPMTDRGSSMRDLQSALTDDEALNERLAGRHTAVFLDYDGTLTPIVDRPQDAVLVDRLLAEHPG
jgi:trehalose 6-phosphate phosphatase